METALLLTLVFGVLELLEVSLQHAATLRGVIARLYEWYRHSIFLFFLVHPTFYFTLFVAVATERLNGYIIMILAMKIFDLFYKLELIKAIYLRRHIPADLEAMLQWQIPTWFFLTGLLLYPPLLYYALQ